MSDFATQQSQLEVIKLIFISVMIGTELLVFPCQKGTGMLTEEIAMVFLNKMVSKTIISPIFTATYLQILHLAKGAFFISK